MMNDAPITSAMARIEAMIARHPELTRPAALATPAFNYFKPLQEIPAGSQRESVRLRREGKTYAAIGRILGIHEITAWRFCRRHGEPRRQSHYNHKTAMLMRARGHSFNQIAAQLGTSKQAARQLWLRRHRGQKEAA